MDSPIPRRIKLGVLGHLSCLAQESRISKLIGLV